MTFSSTWRCTETRNATTSESTWRGARDKSCEKVRCNSTKQRKWEQTAKARRWAQDSWRSRCTSMIMNNAFQRRAIGLPWVRNRKRAESSFNKLTLETEFKGKRSFYWRIFRKQGSRNKRKSRIWNKRKKIRITIFWKRKIRIKYWNRFFKGLWKRVEKLPRGKRKRR